MSDIIVVISSTEDKDCEVLKEYLRERGYTPETVRLLKNGEVTWAERR